MRRPLVASVAALALVVTTVGAAAAVGGAWKAPPFSAIGIYNVQVDSRFLEPDNESVLSIFVETGSGSPNCLVSLNELWGTEHMVQSVFCAARNPDLGNGPIQGVWVHVFFTDRPGPDVQLKLNVYQEGARFFSVPSYCSSEQGC